MTRLSDYTTLGLGGPAKNFVTASSESDLVSAVRAADSSGEPVLILGGGSNLVIADDGFPGTVILVASRGVSVSRAGDVAEVTVAAGEPWDSTVAAAVDAGLAGLECLSGIPGSTGATPVQNVGAYGQEVAESIVSVRALDRSSGDLVVLPAADCRFAYRDSMFKSGEPGRYVVTSVTFRLHVDSLSRPVKYAELASALGVSMGERAPVGEVRSAVVKIRARKGMVLDPGDPDTRSAGSFFTNPVITPAEFAHVEKVASGLDSVVATGRPVPHFPAGADDLVKVPAAWLIEHAGFPKGYGAPGPARVSSKHTLALTNADGATTADLLALAREIVSGVRTVFGVTLVPEPTLIGVSL